MTATMRVASLDRDIHYRPGTVDERVINDVFRARYHIPPDTMPTPATVLDCGAHIGLTMLDYRNRWPNAWIVGVEMDAGNVAMAYLNTADPVLCAAVTAWTGDIPAIGGYDPSLDSWAYTLNGHTGRGVFTLPLFSILAALDWEPVDFLKLDIEGQEKALLKNPKELEQVSAVLVELHGSYTHAEAIRDLRTAGFEAVPHPPHPAAVFAWREI